MQDYQVAIDKKRKIFQEAILRWFTGRSRDYPWRKPGRSPYEILVAEILLKRTTATAAARIYEDVLSRFPSPQAINDADEKELTQVLSEVGLQRQRARAMKALASHLTEVHGGEIPCDLSLLLGIPGLGEYSSRAILSFGFNIPVAVLDANVERVLIRVFQNILPQRPNRHLLQELAGSLGSQRFHRECNLSLLDLGGLVCRYVDPLCERCPLNSICDYYDLDRGRSTKERPGGCGTVVGMKVRKLREERGLGLARLANISGVSKITLIRIESGKTLPKTETIAKLATALQVEPTSLRSEAIQ
jgi:A/G-specific adenine glycosylase